MDVKNLHQNSQWTQSGRFERYSIKTPPPPAGHAPVLMGMGGPPIGTSSHPSSRSLISLWQSYTPDRVTPLPARQTDRHTETTRDSSLIIRLPSSDSYTRLHPKKCSNSVGQLRNLLSCVASLAPTLVAAGTLGCILAENENDSNLYQQPGLVPRQVFRPGRREVIQSSPS